MLKLQASTPESVVNNDQGSGGAGGGGKKNVSVVLDFYINLARFFVVSLPDLFGHVARNKEITKASRLKLYCRIIYLNYNGRQVRTLNGLVVMMIIKLLSIIVI